MLMPRGECLVGQFATVILSVRAAAAGSEQDGLSSFESERAGCRPRAAAAVGTCPTVSRRKSQASPHAPWLALEPRERVAWRGLLLSYRSIVSQLDAELELATGWNLSAFEVLLALSHAPGGGMQMSKLAGAVVMSRSGLTRLVDRLEADGLVRRDTGGADPRHVFACLTEPGREQLAAMIALHVEGIQRCFLDRLGKTHIDALGSAWRALCASDPQLAWSLRVAAREPLEPSPR
jgi:DNA-binding MarR family transcriptional regulator